MFDFKFFRKIFFFTILVFNVSKSSSLATFLSYGKSFFKNAFTIYLGIWYSDFFYNYFHHLINDKKLIKKNIDNRIFLSKKMFDFEVEIALKYDLVFEEKVIGDLSVFFTKNDRAYITSIHIHSYERNQGLGSFLLNKVLSDLEQKENCTFVQLYSTNSNATRLYRRFGFRGDFGYRGTMIKFFGEDENKNTIVMAFLTI